MSKNYKNGMMYMIWCIITNEKYVGSSCGTKEKKLSTYKRQVTQDKKKDRKLFKHMIDFGVENFKIKIIEEWPCDNLYQLQLREAYWQAQFNTVKNGLNEIYATRPIFVTDLQRKINNREKCKLYYEEKKEELLKKQKIYRQENHEKIVESKKKNYYENQDKILEKSKIYYKENKDTIREKQNDKYKNDEEYRNKILEQQKEYRNIEENKITKQKSDKKYRENNKEKIANYKKEWVEKNKDKLKEKIVCECGSKFNRKALSDHNKTLKHLEFIKNKT
jgi:hypothetical protein